ncbi:MAG: NAD(P)H-hydrate dehydratase [Pirellulaceae bacterium]
MNPHQFQYVARKFRAGKISLNDFTDQVFEKRPSDGEAATSDPLFAEALLNRLLDRSADSHKGDYGRVLIVAGSRGMSGAAALSGMAALRCGAGLVTVATADACQETVAGFHPGLMTVGLPSDAEGRIRANSYRTLCDCVPAHDCIAVGPGLGVSESLNELLADIVNLSDVPLVIDADGLNNLGRDFNWLSSECPKVLTPHPGELGRLVSGGSGNRAKQEQAAISLADKASCVAVLKGDRTLITDGEQMLHNGTGNPGMATAGSGDVLTGMIAAIIGQGLSTWEAAVLGCYLHGAAGDTAAKIKSQVGMVATDIIETLPAVFTKSA